MKRFYINQKLPSLNDYIKIERGNRYAAATFKKQLEHAIFCEILSQRVTPVKTAIRLNFIWHEQHSRRDKDNVAFSKKFILDAMQAAGILPNDNNKWVLGFRDDFVYGQGWGVLVEITEEGGINNGS